MKVVAQYTYTNFHAGPKAKIDIERILEKYYNAELSPFRCKKDAVSASEKLVYRLRKAWFMIKNRKKTDILVIQAPFSKKANVNIPSDRRIALVHDIDGLRNGDRRMAAAEIAILDSCDVVISHNDKMTSYLKENGLHAKTVDLLLFDYICEGDIPERRGGFERPTVVYAGNLEKSDFLTALDIDRMNFEFNLYGVGASEDINCKMRYKGAFAPDDLPNILEGDLGLVWDGKLDSSDGDTGFKNYTKYNNPHKLSCYIASGLPVIVWDKSAAADFVTKNNIGYCVSDLYEINSIDFSDYDVKRDNVLKIAQMVRSGIYTKNAMDKALELL